MSAKTILRQLSSREVLAAPSLQPFARDDQVRFLKIRLKYPPVLVFQRVIRKDVQSIFIVKDNGDRPCRANLNLSYQELSRQKNIGLNKTGSCNLRITFKLKRSGGERHG